MVTVDTSSSWEESVSLALAGGCGSLKDRAAGRDFHRGNTSCVQHQESIAVSATEHAGVLRKRVDDVVYDLAFTPRTAIVVHDIEAVPADEPDTKHKPFHVPHTRRAQRQPAMNLRRQCTAASEIEHRSQADSNPMRGCGKRVCCTDR